MSKNKFSLGFTLIEMLLVIAIIGILSGAVFAMIGNSSDAKTKSALSTAKSIMPYAQECFFKGENLNSPVSNHNGGGVLCTDSETDWPGLGPDECDFGSIGNDTWQVDCAFSSGAVNIACDAQDGECVVN